MLTPVFFDYQVITLKKEIIIVNTDKWSVNSVNTEKWSVNSVNIEIPYYQVLISKNWFIANENTFNSVNAWFWALTLDFER